jgi:hypothetical protein
MSDVSTNSILGLIDSDQDDHDDSMTITYAKLLGALIKVLPADSATGLIKYVDHYTCLLHNLLTFFTGAAWPLTTSPTLPFLL